MKFLYAPIRRMHSDDLDDVLISQRFGNKLVAKQDTWYGTVLVRKGQEVYKVLAGHDGHNGVDVVAERGKPIHQPADCPTWVVEQDSKPTGLGKRVSLRHEANGRFFFSSYGHMDRFAGGMGKPFGWEDKSRPVKLGDVIGYVDSTGYSTGDHLHWALYEVDAQGRKLNPTNGFGGAVDPLAHSFLMDIPDINQNEMKLVNDNGTYFLEGVDRDGKPKKIGIADQTALNIFLNLSDVETRPAKGEEIAVFERSNASLTLK